MKLLSMIFAMLAMAAPAWGESGEGLPPDPKSQPAEGANLDTEKTLDGLYRSYFTELNAADRNDDLSALPDSIAYAKKYFTSSLAADIEYVMNEVEGGLGVDFILYAQDFKDVSLKSITPIKSAPSSPRFDVAFENMGAVTTVRVTMIRQGLEWRIADIDYEGGMSLAKWLADSKNGEE
jgi:hypothetical protein